MARPTPPTDNICLDIHAVQHCVTYGQQQLARLEASDKFPKRIRLGPNRIGWSFREIMDWMQSKVDARPVGPMSPKVTISTEDRFIHPKELRSMVLYSRSHVRNLEAAGEFPRHIWLSDNRVVWLEREVREWLKTKCPRGAATAALKTYHVRLCRPRFEVTTLTVKERDVDAAKQAALAMANASKSGWRLLPYQPEIYRPHVDTFVQDEPSSQSITAVENMLASYADSYVRYLLLYTDTKLDQAAVLPQPWLESVGGRIARNLAAVWSEGLNPRVKPLIKRSGNRRR